MKVAVTTPTGNIGSKLTAKLIEAGADVTILVRNADKVKDFTKRGAKARQGDLTDPDFVSSAIAGADVLFWLTPPNLAAEDPRAFQRTLGQVAVTAVRASGTPRVVNLSSIGGHLASGTGMIAGLHEVEVLLDATDAHVTHLRAGYFMENYLMSLDGIKSMSSIFLPVSGSATLPMVATQDIADGAAKRIMDDGWSGRSVRGFHGPEDLSFDRAAEYMGEVLGRRITHVSVTSEQMAETLGPMGVSARGIELALEMYASFDAGLEVAEPRTPETTTSTTFQDFVRDAIKPLI